MPSTIETIHLDRVIIALNKPTGLLSVPGIGPEKADCLAARIQRDHPEARIVHRLDRDTSGVIVMALDPKTHRELSRQFQDRETQKRYIAIVAGTFAAGHDEGTIDLPMRKDMDHRPCMTIDTVRGKPSVTQWRVLAREGDRTRLELTPITGRSHQLRLHLKTIGHPIIGDELYAPPAIAAMSDRLMLHAASLTIFHPKMKRLMTFIAPCPF
ncbi:MAG: RluA family pseudouridine synthase [Phycisphaerales bacterium]|nr:RluA family pseudouridine synthase [Phycisphaerales bacterium]